MSLHGLHQKETVSTFRAESYLKDQFFKYDLPNSFPIYCVWTGFYFRSTSEELKNLCHEFWIMSEISVPICEKFPTLLTRPSPAEKVKQCRNKIAFMNDRSWTWRNFLFRNTNAQPVGKNPTFVQCAFSFLSYTYIREVHAGEKCLVPFCLCFVPKVIPSLTRFAPAAKLKGVNGCFSVFPKMNKCQNLCYLSLFCTWLNLASLMKTSKTNATVGNNFIVLDINNHSLSCVSIIWFSCVTEIKKWIVKPMFSLLLHCSKWNREQIGCFWESVSFVCTKLCRSFCVLNSSQCSAKVSTLPFVLIDYLPLFR